MTKERLKELGLSEEHIKAVLGEFEGKYVPKHRFDEANGELKTAKEALKERDGQLESLKKSTGDVEALAKQITDLQAANTAKDEAHAAEVKAVRVNAAVSAALSSAKARNQDTVKPLLKEFLDKAELDGETIQGLDKEIEKLAKGENTAFLFDTAVKPKTKGFEPAQSKDPQGGGDDAFLAGFDSD